ncbi:Polycystic kidney disease protein 1-like 3 [Actinoplanes sp. SE50]|nr:Polycystic kidney disease protein 1-like 3 [Actinoplanes sp. SE50/110]ATO87530.1 Polycystic kidney disease protein 1-like 3 [Actinoplanes sp. SE50]SLM04948.1 Polycystic kidney disease protein 1-like 3 [Actinoplanes sp. SE50/110]
MAPVDNGAAGAADGQPERAADGTGAARKAPVKKVAPRSRAAAKAVPAANDQAATGDPAAAETVKRVARPRKAAAGKPPASKMPASGAPEAVKADRTPTTAEADQPATATAPAMTAPAPATTETDQAAATTTPGTAEADRVTDAATPGTAEADQVTDAATPGTAEADQVTDAATPGTAEADRVTDAATPGTAKVYAVGASRTPVVGNAAERLHWAVADQIVVDLWPRLVAEPRDAARILAEAAVQTLGPRAAAWAARTRAAYPAATPQGLARLATAQSVRAAERRGILSALSGTYAPIALVASAALTHADLVLHVAAAYGVDPTDPERAAELVVLLPSYRGGAAWAALRLADRAFPGASMLGAVLGGRNTAEAVAVRAERRYGWYASRRSQE